MSNISGLQGVEDSSPWKVAFPTREEDKAASPNSRDVETSFREAVWASRYVNQDIPTQFSIMFIEHHLNVDHRGWKAINSTAFPAKLTPLSPVPGIEWPRVYPTALLYMKSSFEQVFDFLSILSLEIYLTFMN